MGVTQTIIDNIKTAALDEFDSDTHIGFGTGTTTEAPSQTALVAEVERNAFDEASVRDDSAGTYDFSATLGLTEGNGSTMAEVAVFNASSSGTMSIRKLLTATVAKTATIELSVGIRATITVTGD